MERDRKNIEMVKKSKKIVQNSANGEVKHSRVKIEDSKHTTIEDADSKEKIEVLDDMDNKIDLNKFPEEIEENERLRLTLQAQRKKETALILRKYGSKAEYLLKQKDEEIAKATNKTIELEDFLKRIEMENQTWQRMAKENEAMVMSLNNTIEQLRENICLSNRGAEESN